LSVDPLLIFKHAGYGVQVQRKSTDRISDIDRLQFKSIAYRLIGTMLG
jgi:hypothetical protein